TSNVVLCHGLLTPSVSDSLKFMCQCGNNLSNPKIKRAPIAKPTAAGMTFTKPSPGLISIPGANKHQKLAATITPPVKPSMPSKKALFIPFIKKTNDAPSAVKTQVNNEAYKAPNTGSIVSK